MTGTRWRTNWIRVEFVPRIHVSGDSSENPQWFARTEHWTWKIHRSHHLQVHVERPWLDKKRKRWDLFFEFRKSQAIREETLVRTLDVPRSWRRKEMEWNSQLCTWRKMGFYSHSDGGTIQRNRSALSRGILKKKKGRDTIHFSGDSTNTELLFQTNHSVNQLSIYGAVSNWCEQFGLTENEMGQEKRLGKGESVTRGVLTSVKSQEVNLLTSSPRSASGSSLREKIQDFESLSDTIRIARVCEDVILVHRVSAGMSYKSRPDEDDGFGQIIPLCREYTLSRVNLQSRACAAIHGGTIIGTVIEVQIVKILDSYGLEIAIPSPNDSSTFWYPEERIDSWTNCTFPMSNIESPAQNYFLNIRMQKKANLACLAHSKTSIQETGAAVTRQTGIQETGADSQRRTGSGNLFVPINCTEEPCQQRSPKWLQDWCVIMIKMNDHLTQRFIGTR